MNNKIDFKKLAQDFLQSGVPKQTAKDLGLPKNVVYDLALNIEE